MIHLICQNYYEITYLNAEKGNKWLQIKNESSKYMCNSWKKIDFVNFLSLLQKETECMELLMQPLRVV